MAHVPTITLNNGVKMPQLGLGVFQASVDEAKSAVLAALQAGYRLIDTAAFYQNEEGVGQAVLASGVPREEIFITTKLWNGDHRRAAEAFETSLNKLGLDYVDLYLIHWPVPAQDAYVEAWQTLEKLYANGKVRAIGVSNFLPEHLERLAKECKIVPTIDQVELHPNLQEHEVRKYASKHGIAVESWSPIMRGSNALQDDTLVKIASAHGKTPAQVVIRWHIQHGFVAIPKSVHEERIRENIDVFDFELSGEDMQAIDGMETGQRIGPDPRTLS